MNSYHNTTNEVDPKLFEVKARTQEQIVYKLFQKHIRLTVSKVQKLYPDFRVQVRSMGRSVTNLATDYYRKNGSEVTKFHVVRTRRQPETFPMSIITKEAKIFKTTQKEMGPNGRKECVYEIVNGYDTV